MDSKSYACASYRRVGRRYEGVCAVVEIKQRALSTLQQNVSASLQVLVNNALHRRYERSKPFGPLTALVKYGRHGYGSAVVDSRNDLVSMIDYVLQSGKERFDVQKISRSDAGPGSLVGISRADSLARRADGIGAPCLFGQVVEDDVIWHHYMSSLADKQTL